MHRECYRGCKLAEDKEDGGKEEGKKGEEVAKKAHQGKGTGSKGNREEGGVEVRFLCVGLFLSGA